MKKIMNISSLFSSKDSRLLGKPLDQRQFATNRKFKPKKRPKYHAGSLINSAPITFNIVLNQLGKSIDFNCDLAIKEVINFHDRMIRNHSVVEGSARYNSIRLYAIMLLEDRNPEPLDRVAVGKKDRWPSAFNQLRPLFYRVRDQKCTISDRIIRSILYLNRLCNGNDNPDLSEIEKSFDVPSEFRERYRSYLEKACPRSGNELITKPSTRVLSNGPNGKPKWQTADVEAYALLNSELKDSFKSLCSVTNNNDLYEYMQKIAAGQNRVERKRLRYITTIRDKGNKCRLVAISDYWTQVLLEPIMTDVQNFINTRFSNVSYSKDHSLGFEKMKSSIRPGVKSYDVSSWTDAFPSSLQLDFMTARYGRDIANAWYSLVVSCEWNVKGRTDKLVYQRGQGMGTNGSFDIATATDLFLLEMIYSEDYQMSISATTFQKVGDDLSCYDPDEYILNTYKNMCGIDINQAKTKFATENNLCGEFVSRSINYGKDVSRISANICRAVKKNLLDLPQLAFHLQERGYETFIPIAELFDNLKIKEQHQRNLVRTFYLLCKLYPNMGLNLLEKSLINSVPDLVYSDDIIALTKSVGIEGLKDTFNIYQILKLLNVIVEKSERIFDSASEFDSSKILMENSEPDVYWKTDDSIELLTSKYIMSKSFLALREWYSADRPESVIDLINGLEAADSAMTFKKLGVISEKISWRPKTTKLYNFSKSLVVPDLNDHVTSLEFQGGDFAKIVPWFQTSIDIEIFNNYFEGIPRNVIGKSDTNSGHLTGKG